MQTTDISTPSQETGYHSTPFIENSWEWQETNRVARLGESRRETYAPLGSDVIGMLEVHPDLLELPAKLQEEVENGTVKAWGISRIDIFDHIDIAPRKDAHGHFLKEDIDLINKDFVLRANFEEKLSQARTDLLSAIIRPDGNGHGEVFYVYAGRILPDHVVADPSVAKALKYFDKAKLPTAHRADKHHRVLINAVEAMGREDVIETLATHNKLQAEERNDIEAILPEAIGHFDRRIRELVASGTFPESALLSWEKRRERLAFKVIDPFKDANLGYFEPISETIALATFRGKIGRKLESTIFHELLHSISRNTRSSFDFSSKRMGITQASGLWQYGQDRSASSDSRVGSGFDLNEALTEIGTELIEHGSNSIKKVKLVKGVVHVDYRRTNYTYADQRALVAILLQHGLTLQDCFGAYFDQYNPSAEAGERNSGFAALQTKLAKIGGQGFGRKLGAIFAGKGLHEAAQFIESSAGVRRTKLQKVGRAVVMRSSLPFKTPEGHKPYKSLDEESSVLRRKQIAKIREDREFKWWTDDD